MKIRSVIAVCGALLWVVNAGAQTGSSAAPAQDPNRPAKKADPKAAPATKAAGAKADPKAPAAKAAPAKKDDKKGDDEIGKIEGMEIPRGKGFLGVQIANGTFKISFYDAKKKPVKPDVVRAALRWNVAYQKVPERAILNSNGVALVSEKIVKPPYSFRLFVTLFKPGFENATDSDAGVENLSFDFSQ